MRAKVPPWTWRLYPLGRREGWTLKYWDHDGARREHAVPLKYRDEGPAKKYAVAWIAERKRLVADSVAAQSTIPPASSSNGLTFGKFAERWTNGELHKQYPDHVALKTTVDDDRQRLRDHINPIIGDIPLVELVGAPGLERADEVMSKLPSLSSQTRRHVAQTIHRIFGMAVYPARLIPANPLPRGWLPRVKNNRARAYLYPDEDAKLLACTEVPLVRRLLYGFLAREGCRPSEALRLQRPDLDLERAAVTLDRNKTDDPRGAKMMTVDRLACLIGCKRKATACSARLSALEDAESRRSQPVRTVHVCHHVTGAEAAASQEHVLADHPHHVAQPASWLLPDLSAAGDEQFVARPARVLVDPSLRPVAPRAFDADFVGQSHDPLGVRLPSVVALRCLMEAARPTRGVRHDEPVLVAV
jgi:hypothetical protein